MSDDAWHSVPLSHLGNPAGLPVVKSQNLAVREEVFGNVAQLVREVDTGTDGIFTIRMIAALQMRSVL